MRKLLVLGGVLGSLSLLAFGVVSIVLGANGRSDVRHRIERENIVGTPDMKPSTEVPAYVTDKPTCDVADEPITDGDQAKCFASWMRVHALEATKGQTYAELPRYIGKNGKPTSDEEKAKVDPETGKPVENELRQTWLNETAFATALNTSYFAEQEANYAIVVGIIMIIAGVGFLVLTLTVLRSGLEDRK